MPLDIRQLLRAASRTFALSIEQLPGVVGDAMCLAYLLLRASDFLEDNGHMPPARKVELLGLWDQILAGEADPRALLAQLHDLPPAEANHPDAQVALNAVE